MEKSLKMKELLRVYQDLERTLAAWKVVAEKKSTLKHINVSDVINRLKKRKKMLERKLGNKLLLEKHQLQLKISRALKSPSKRAS